MKKIMILCIVLSITMLFSQFQIKAEDYQNYQEIIFKDEEGLLLKDYDSDDLDDEIDKIKKKKFIGWRLSVLNENEEVEFVSETKLKIYNNGFTPIAHDITLETKDEEKTQISVTGGIKITGSGNVKKFKGSIDADIKATVSYSSTTLSRELYEFKIIVDPLTYVKIITKGTGIINNGVGKCYFFWIKTNSGGWETFTVTTEYYEIIKERL